jgi:uncharacterized protein
MLRKRVAACASGRGRKTLSNVRQSCLAPSFNASAGLPQFGEEMVQEGEGRESPSERLSLWATLGLAPRRFAHVLIRAYQLSFSALIGRQCRYLPTCSEYTDEAIARHGLWAGSFMGAARLCRCHPWGGAGFDPIPQKLPPNAHWALPWRYGQWRQRPSCEQVVPPCEPRQR